MSIPSWKAFFERTAKSSGVTLPVFIFGMSGDDTATIYQEGDVWMIGDLSKWARPLSDQELTKAKAYVAAASRVLKKVKVG